MREPVSAGAKVATLPRTRSRRGPAKITRDLVQSLRPEADPYEQRDSELKGFLVRVQPSGVMTYYIEIARGKRLKLGRADVLRPHIARDRAERILGNVANGRDPWDGMRQEPTDKVPTLGEFVAGTNPDETDVRKWDGDYATWYAANRKAGRAYTENMQRLRKVFGHWWNLPITEITAGMLETLKVERKRKHGNDNATIRRDLSRLRGVFRLARKHGYPNDAFEEIELPYVDERAGKVRFLFDDERKRLHRALEVESTAPYLRAMVLLALNTGMRRGELFALTWENVDFRRGVITVVGKTAKTERTRHIPINRTARAALEAWRPKHATGIVFPGKVGQFSTVKKSWATLLKLAEIKNFRWHDMRHDFASRLVMAGIDLNTVRELLGHDRIQTTMRYAHLAPSHKTAAVEVLDQ